jgi:xanthine dehydrogenase large subunit
VTKKKEKVFYNIGTSTAMRGFGGPEAQIVIEEIVDRIAHEIKKDPNDIKEVG